MTELKQLLKVLEVKFIDQLPNEKVSIEDIHLLIGNKEVVTYIKDYINFIESKK